MTFNIWSPMIRVCVCFYACAWAKDLREYLLQSSLEMAIPSIKSFCLSQNRQNLAQSKSYSTSKHVSFSFCLTIQGSNNDVTESEPKRKRIFSRPNSQTGFGVPCLLHTWEFKEMGQEINSAFCLGIAQKALKRVSITLAIKLLHHSEPSLIGWSLKL